MEAAGRSLAISPHLTRSLSCLGKSTYRQGRYQEAIGWHTKALNIHRTVEPDHLASVADDLTHLALCYQASKDHAKAIEAYDMSLSIKRSIYNEEPDHPSIAVSLTLQANSFWSTGDFKKGLEQQKLSLEMLQRHYQGTPQPDVATTFYHIGDHHIQHSQRTEAEEALQESIRIWRQLPSAPPDSMARSLCCLGRVFLARKQLERAIHMLEEGLEMFREVLPGDHEDIKSSERFLEGTRAKIAAQLK